MDKTVIAATEQGEYWYRLWCARGAEIEWLTRDRDGFRGAYELQRERADEVEAEIERLRVLLKHLKGVAQDSDDTAVMAEIDAMLSGSWPNKARYKDQRR